MKKVLFLLIVFSATIAFAASAHAESARMSFEQSLPPSPLYHFDKIDESRYQITKQKQTWYTVAYPDTAFYYSFKFPKPKTVRARSSYGF
jgi:hypothetical protein